ncbi:MAG: M20 family metallo-hydrolase [Prevotella sp.]|nr:M20 family metallo-hydrolase [Prevotella sp.]MBQ8154659.1 M20 family metallo-hydrolase [Prevotella sp.]
MAYKKYTNEAVALLSRLISTPSVSRDEQAATDILQKQIKEWGLPCKRSGNNLIVAQRLSKKKPTLLLNAHIDTVKPVASWTRDPFTPTIEDGKLFGLGANDCGGGLVSLLQAYRILSEKKSIPYNLVYVASCEEEVSGQNGFSAVLPYLPPIDVAIVGEPTGMQPAIAEKGLMVIDGVAHGISGHAARNEGVNAINEALDDLQWLRAYQFRKVSPLLGETKATVTVIHGGTQHNVIPDKVEFVIDVRTNEYYQNEYLFAFLQKHMKSELKARSFRLHSSSIPEDHPLVKKCKRMRMKPFGSPTLSDQALMPFPSFKLGPGESSRSHSADEFVKIEEIHQAINTYVKLISE